MKKCVLITGASGFAGYHLTAAALASDSEAFVAASSVSNIRRASRVSRKKNNYKYYVVSAGYTEDLALTTFSDAKTGDNSAVKTAAKIVKALISNVTNRQYKVSDGNIYGRSVLAEGMDKQHMNKITLPERIN